MKRAYAILILMLCGSAAVACNIPVFRYALERWKPDASEIVVVHRGKLNDVDQTHVTALQERAGSSAVNSMANLEFTFVDLAEKHSAESVPDAAAIEKFVQGHELPFVLLRAPATRNQRRVVWSGPLAELSDVPVLDSPARRELSSRLVSGDAVVWLLLTSSDPEKDRAIQTSLEQQFDQLSASIPFPEGIGEPGSELYSDIPLLMKFSVLKIDRDDPREMILVNLLTNRAGGGRDATDEPLVVPVFGRGRALEVIPGSELSTGLVRDLTEFLCSACSCQVKDLNPGFDLLLHQDWDTALFGEGIAAPAPRPGKTGERSKEPTLIPIPAGRGGGDSPSL